MEVKLNLDFIRDYMKDHDLSLNAFRKKVGLTTGTAWRIMNGQRTMRVSTLLKIINGMKLSKDDLTNIFSFDKSLRKGKK